MRRPSPAVTFDLWHTLVYLRPEDEETYMQFQRAIAVRVLEGSDPLPGTPAIRSADLGAAFDKEYNEAVAAAAEGRTVPPVDQFLRAARATGRVPRAEQYLRALEQTVASTPFRLAHDALDVLRRLRELGYAVGVISNTIGEPGRFLRPILRQMGFDEFVQVYTFSDEHPWAKPAPEMFRASLAALGSAPAAAVHIGDGWSDIEGARRAGMVAGVLFTGLQKYGERYRELFMPTGRERPTAAHVVNTLPEVVPLVRQLLQKADADDPAASR